MSTVVVWRSSDADLLAELGALETRLHFTWAQMLSVVAEIDARNMAPGLGYGSTVELVRAITRIPRSEARARISAAADVPVIRSILARDGGYELTGWLDREAAEILRSALSPLAAPRPSTDTEIDLRTTAQRDANAPADARFRGVQYRLAGATSTPSCTRSTTAPPTWKTASRSAADTTDSSTTPPGKSR